MKLLPSPPVKLDDPLSDKAVGRMMKTIVFFAIAGFVVLLFQSVVNKPASILLAFACISIGGFAGFLFGIPRVLQSEKGPQDPAMTQSSSHHQINTNLEQISDWLTKIIVGLGLVNMNSIPDMIRTTSMMIAGGISNSKSYELATIFSNAIIVYFPVMGFLSGYLITRVFLSGVIRRADNELMSIGGQTVPLNDVVKNLVNIVTNQTATGNSNGNALGNLRNPLTPATVLWVDDRPKNNLLEREAMKNSNIKIISSFTTSQAIAELSAHTFDLIITDMARKEDGVEKESAGITFLEHLKLIEDRDGAHIRTLVYCSKQGAIKYGDRARELGADDVLTSFEQLMKALGLK